MDKQTALHNQLAGKIVKEIVATPLSAGGEPGDVLVLTESILTGVMLMLVKDDGDDGPVLDALMNGVKRRLAAIRLKTEH